MSWELEGLFRTEVFRQWQDTDGLAAVAEAEQGSIWTMEPTGLRVGEMGYRTRTIKAGPRLEAEVYPVFGRADAGRIRAARKNLTSESQRRLNHERSIRRMIQLADANFGRRDYHLTLTYKRVPSYEQSQRDVRNFLARLRRIRKNRGLDELKYIYTIEGAEETAGWRKKTRIHIHMLLNGGISREELEEIWGKGYANADRLDPDENGLEGIARYLTKQQRNRRKWCPSRNLKQPTERVSNSKCSNARVRRIAADFENRARAEMEKIYPGYRYVKCSVYQSDVVSGVYIRCVMRKIE